MPKRAPPLNAKQLEKWCPDPSQTLELIDGAVSCLRVRLSPHDPPPELGADAALFTPAFEPVKKQVEAAQNSAPT